MANVTQGNKGDLGHEAQKIARSLGEKVEDAVNVMGKKADSLSVDAGKGLKHMGDRIAQNAPRAGMIGHASQGVADGLKESGKYLEKSKLSGLAKDVGALVKNNPIPAILLGLGLGVMLGRLTRA